MREGDALGAGEGGRAGIGSEYLMSFSDGVSGGVSRGEATGGGRASRELDLRREPREVKVSGGRTFVEDARCLLGGGGGAREAITRDGNKRELMRPRLGAEADRFPSRFRNSL